MKQKKKEIDNWIIAVIVILAALLVANIFVSGSIFSALPGLTESSPEKGVFLAPDGKGTGNQQIMYLCSPTDIESIDLPGDLCTDRIVTSTAVCLATGPSNEQEFIEFLALSECEGKRLQALVDFNQLEDTLDMQCELFCETQMNMCEHNLFNDPGACTFPPSCFAGGSGVVCTSQFVATLTCDCHEPLGESAEDSPIPRGSGPSPEHLG